MADHTDSKADLLTNWEALDQAQRLIRYEKFYENMTPDQRASIYDRGFEVIGNRLPLPRPSRSYITMLVPGPIEFHYDHTQSLETFGAPDPHIRIPKSVAGQIERMTLEGIRYADRWGFGSPVGRRILVFSDPEWRPVWDILAERYPVEFK